MAYGEVVPPPPPAAAAPVPAVSAVASSMGWDDPIASCLEESLLLDLSKSFQTAIMRIMELNYTKDEAELSVLNSELSYGGGKELVTEIFESALMFLNEGKKDLESIEFDDLEDKAEYILLEMLNVLTDVKPSISISEAMWLLLIFDLNLSNACSTSESNEPNLTNNAAAA